MWYDKREEEEKLQKQLIKVEKRMSCYQFRFWFEHCGPCLWGMNDKAQEKFGYPIESKKLPISRSLVKKIDALEREYGTYLDWACPQNPSPWTEEHKIDFVHRANLVYDQLKNELGSEFEITNEVTSSV
ncbi:MAG: hypothetical protein SO147_07465 [Clostridia bacterium]|nr:hypothetical protein [Clostridia bacterium]